jgi:hypothetical protein
MQEFLFLYEKYFIIIYCFFIFGLVALITENGASFEKENINSISVVPDVTVPIKYENKYKLNDEPDDELTQEKLEGLLNCFILENTPNGNALILYNHNTNSFIYYSDHSIPYKYLNTLARKYVKTFKCKKLYINVEPELEPDKKLHKDTELDKPLDNPPEKKKVFAKFKSYNTDTCKMQSQNKEPPQNRKSQENIDIPSQIKEKFINRYTYQGKIANFNFLKKVDKKLVNKKLALTFAEFKKLNISI